jgi:hypothetical protein
MALQVGELYASLTLRKGQFDQALNQAEGRMHRFDQSMQNTFDGIRTAGLYATAGLVVGFGAAAYAGVKANSDTEQFLATMTRLTGSTEKAKAELQNLKEFAKQTPFEMSDLKQGELIMRAVGLQTEKWRETIGDTAAAWKSAGKSYQDVVQAIADAQTGELERLKEFGISKQQIIDKANKMFRNKEIVNQKGQITDLTRFNEALLQLMKDRYGGMMKVQSQTFAGMLSNIKDFGTSALETLSRPLFNKLNAGAKSTMNTLQDFQNNGTLDVWAEEIGDNIDSVIDFFKQVDWSLVGTIAQFTAAAGATFIFIRSIQQLVTASRLLMASMGPAGWIAAGLSVIVGMTAASERETTNLSLAQAKQAEMGLKQVQANELLIDSYERLRLKSTWTNAEFLRYLDLQKLIANESNPKTVKEYQAEMDRLARNSGLSNTELSKMLRLNGEITKVLPEGTQAISKQGSAIATNVDSYRKLNEQKREQLRLELETQRTVLQSQEPKLLAERARAYKEFYAQQSEAARLQSQIESESLIVQQKQKEIQDLIRQGRKDETVTLQSELAHHQSILTSLGEQYQTAIKNRDQARQEINDLNEKLNRIQAIGNQLAAIADAEASAAQDQINKNNQKIAQLEEMRKKHGANVQEINQEIQRLQQANGQLSTSISRANSLKSAIMGAASAASTLNSRLAAKVYKDVVIRYKQIYDSLPATTRSIPGVAAELANQRLRLEGSLKRHRGGTIPKIPGVGEVPALLKGGETILTQRHTNELMRLLESGQSTNGKRSIHIENINLYQTEATPQGIVRVLQDHEMLYGD